MSYDYNKISKLYDDVREADLKTVEFLISTAQLHENSRVLEIGCGTGNYLRLVQILTKAELWGIDSSQGMLSKAREKSEGAILIEGDAVELSEIPDSYFDLVYMVDVIHHIQNIYRMFQNIKRVLKKNGRVVVFSDNYQHIRNRLTTKYFPETLEAELKRYQDTPELIQSLSSCGFLQIQEGIIEIGDDSTIGPRLIEIAAKKGYSMFGLISEEAIKTGIERIQVDMKKGVSIIYHQRAPYVAAVK
jgi:ubiquinone/menaquinone biosynthesis C-methylase UbiE